MRGIALDHSHFDPVIRCPRRRPNDLFLRRKSIENTHKASVRRGAFEGLVRHKGRNNFLTALVPEPFSQSHPTWSTGFGCRTNRLCNRNRDRSSNRDEFGKLGLLDRESGHYQPAFKSVIFERRRELSALDVT